ncbi:acyltransferase [Pseudomonas gingeri]|uniref:acyltransferase family protein n=1 Tax=Pseudomonas gingeri TaxID=117681 RepID=UPI0015A1F373|nr:acyltransferase [Pseudomonas gingeri]NWA24925.1 acyltransferase [Pseudomonas gingeri]
MSVGLRNPRIDLIRGVSIFLVLLHHFNIAYHLNDTTLADVLGWDAVRAVARNGNYGVTMFFVISGYLITSNAHRRWPGLVGISARAFYGMRIARIVPCLLLLVVIVNVLALGGVAIFQNNMSAGTPVSFWTVNLASLTFWMNVLISARGWVNYPLGVLWSLSVEEVFYLTFPILCRLLQRESRLLAFWGMIIIAAPLYRFTHQGDEEGFLYDYFACFDGIAIGCCTALLAGRMPLYGSVAKILQALTLGAMAFLYLYWPIGQSNVFGVTAMALGTAVLLLGAHHHPSGSDLQHTRLLAGLGWLGRLSYELYLFHLIVLGAMRTIFPPRVVVGDEKTLLLVMFFVLSAALSAAVARFYSEPLNRSIRRYLARHTLIVTV